MANVELTQYTVKEAAEALGVSIRTMRRRISAGKLSASKLLRGGQEVTVIDGAELARYGQSVGQSLEHRGADRPQMPSDATSTQGQTVEQQGQIGALSAEVHRQQRAIASLEVERDALLRILENLTKALPPMREVAPAPVEQPKRRWWQLWQPRRSSGGG